MSKEIRVADGIYEGIPVFAADKGGLLQSDVEEWTAMRAALPGRLAAMQYDPDRIERFMALVPEEYQEPAGLGSIAMAGVPQPEFVTYGPQPMYSVAGSEALPEGLLAATDAILTDLEQGEL